MQLKKLAMKITGSPIAFHCRLASANGLLLHPNILSILLLQFEKTFCTQTAIIQFRYVLYFIDAELHHAALTFSVRICLAFNSCSASFAGNDFVFAMF